MKPEEPGADTKSKDQLVREFEDVGIELDLQVVYW